MRHLCGICNQEMEIDESHLIRFQRDVIDECPPERRSAAMEAMEAMVAKVLPGVCHSACIEAQTAQLETDAQRLVRHRRLQRWNKACPKAFQETEYGRIKFRPKAEVLAHIASGGSALLKGETGCGKTRLVWIACKAPHMAGKTVHIWSHIGFSKHAAAEAMKGANFLNTLLFKTSDADLLVIDDFGKGRFQGSDGQSLQNEEILFELLDRRLNHKRQTIITTNHTGETLEMAMTSDKGAPLVRRIRDLCKVFSHE